MRLAIIIPTYNRSASLARTLDSILHATVPDGLQISVTAVDNRSKDDTKAVVEHYSQLSDGMIRYVPESCNQGRSFALNTGIRQTDSDLVAFIDDDEEIEENWPSVIFSTLADPNIDYIGGRYLPRWEREPPAWVNHPHTRTAIGWADFGEDRRPFSDEKFDALLMGGNCVLRRSCFDKVGLYCSMLGRKGNRLLAGEDSEMHDRLIEARLNGLYVPELVVYHHIPAERVTRRYMRRWAFWASASTGYLLRKRPPPEPRWFGLPRYLFTNAIRAELRWLHSVLLKRHPAEVFSYELRLWRFGGTFYGRHFLTDPSID